MKPKLSVSNRNLSVLITVLNIFALFAPVSAAPGRGILSPQWHDYFWTNLLVSPNMWALLGAFSLALSIIVHTTRVISFRRLPFWLMVTTTVCHLTLRSIPDFDSLRLYLPFRSYGDIWTTLVFAGAVASCLSLFAQLVLLFLLARTRRTTSQELSLERELVISKNHIALVLAVIAGLIAIFQWWHIGYRLHEYITFYHSEPGMNHIDDSRFLLIHVINCLLLGSAFFAVVTIRKEGFRHKALICSPFVVNLLGWLTIIVMRYTGILVPLSEFMKNRKGS